MRVLLRNGGVVMRSCVSPGHPLAMCHPAREPTVRWDVASQWWREITLRQVWDLQTWHAFKSISCSLHSLWSHWCFLAPFKSLRWGPISSPLPPPHIIRIYKETHISNIVQLQNQAQLQICKHLQTSCCSLFFPDISLQPSSNHRNFQLSNWKGSNLYVKNINP